MILKKNGLLILCLILGVIFSTFPASIASTDAEDVPDENLMSDGYLEIIYDGCVKIYAGEFVWTDTDGLQHQIQNFTPHGALDISSKMGYFDYEGGWKDSKNTVLIDKIGDYEYDKSVSPKLTWNYQLNGIYQNYFSEVTGMSNNLISDGDYVEFYYGPDQETTDNATAVIRITVNCDEDNLESRKVDDEVSNLDDWTLTLSGAITETVTRADFEESIAQGHVATYSDDYGTWEGVPLWVLVGMVDDEGDISSFNHQLAEGGYSVKVIAGDGWDTTLDRTNIAGNDGYIVANSLNGEPLPAGIGDKNKPCWPLHLKGAEVFGGQQVGNITKIELTGLSQSSGEWKLGLFGDVSDVISQTEFEIAVADYGLEYWDDSGVWNGLPLWRLMGIIDDIETEDRWTFNEAQAAANYSIVIIATDGYNRRFSSLDIAKNDGYLVANILNDQPLAEKYYPLRLVGEELQSGKDKVGKISEIHITELETPSPDVGSYNLNLIGRISDEISQSEIRNATMCHKTSWIDEQGNNWSGVPLWVLCGWVDDRTPHGSMGFNDELAAAGYKIIVKAGDGYAKEFSSAEVARSDDYIVANLLNGSSLEDCWPLRLVGPGAPGGKSVGNVVEIELTEFSNIYRQSLSKIDEKSAIDQGLNKPSSELPSIHVIKYDSDGITVLNETTVSYEWMEQNLPVYGDGTTSYRFEGVDFTDDHWDINESYPGGYKIDRVVKGSSVRDLCDLVGGMGVGTEIKLVADDGYETSLGYENIYTEYLSTENRERQGEAFLAWWSEDQGYVPQYSNGMRLFFMASESDHIFGLWDMHECMDQKYWHYYWDNNVQYPSCAGLSAKYIDTIKIYSAPEADWNLSLAGGINDTISKSYFEQALACTMGGHKSQYEDDKGQIWEGLPLWLICGWVDDDNSHSGKAYNESMAEKGYNVTITSSDGYSITIDCRDTIRNDNYIVANTLDGVHISKDDPSWPLRLVGVNVSGADGIKGIAKITLSS